MKWSRRSFDIFSVSFLDVIACGFGAITLLVLISRNSPSPPSASDNSTPSLLHQAFSVESVIQTLSQELAISEEEKGSKQLILDRLQKLRSEAESTLTAKRNEVNKLRNDLEGLSLVDLSLKRASIQKSTATTRSKEVGGISVDSEYVIFVIDNSGSMKEIWGRVIKELENVIRAHPRMKGFQVLNDSGFHLMSTYEGQWIPDTPKIREIVVNLLRSWNSASSSSPVKGMELALKKYARANITVSIYVFGDDYTGSSYDPAINSITSLNADRTTGKQLAKIHAVGFISRYTTDRFPTLMREVTRLNGGTFIALPR